jgi:hypothetical protein
MSMMARFVAVTPEHLNAMKKSPDLVEELLARDTGSSPFEFSAALQERARAMAPQMLGGMLEKMTPEMRQQLMQYLGVGEKDLNAANVADAILKRMSQGAGAARQPSPQAEASALKNVSLDKAWHGLHYLLCGAAEAVPGALGQAVLGGTEIGDDLGYGAARFFTPAEAKEIARALQEPTLEQALHARFNPTLMESHGLYPGGWDREGDDWLIEAFRTLRAFYADASAAGQAVIAVLE